MPIDSTISAQPVRIFISYRHADHRVLDELRNHLGWLENSNQIRVFDDRNVLAGDDWDTRIKTELEQAEIIILIVTAKFMHSPYCTKVELRSALERHATEGTRIIPIIAETCDWEAMPIFRIASLPKDRAQNLKPLNKWRGDKDVALTQIAQQVRKNLEQLTSGQFARSQKNNESPNSPPAPREVTRDVVPQFYVYVSDMKLAMLSSQIPDGTRRHLANELGFDEGIVSAPSPPQPLTPSARFALVRLVERYLAQQDQIGTIDEPKAYFQGELSLKWGGYETFTTKWDEPSPLVYFGGSTVDTILGLGGSAHHVIGAIDQRAAHSHSATPYMVAALCKGLELPVPEATKAILKKPKNFFERYFGRDTSGNIAMAVDLATTQMLGTEQRLKFLARRLAFFPRHTHQAWSENMNILLGSPLYVALSE